MPEEEYVEKDGEEERQEGNDPDDQGEQHGEVDDRLLPVSLLDHGFDVEEKLGDGRFSLGRCMVSFGYEPGLYNSPQRQGVDNDAWALCQDNDQSTFELEVDEKGNVVDALSALGQFSKDQEAAPSLAAFGQSQTLEDGGQRFKIALGDAARAYDAECANPSVGQEDVGDDDADGENPLCDVEIDFGFDLARPFVEGEEIDGGKGVGSVDGARDDDEDPQPNVGKGCEAGCRLEVREGDVVPLLLRGDGDALLAVATTAHDCCLYYYVLYPLNGAVQLWCKEWRELCQHRRPDELKRGGRNGGGRRMPLGGVVATGRLYTT